MATTHFDGEAGGVVFVQLHVGDQRRSREGAFHQVVAEDQVLRKAPVGGATERVHVVDAFADVRSFGEHVLVHVGHLSRVRVDARVARAEPGKARATGGQQADRRARLQNGVPLDHSARPLVKPRPVQRVSQRADELAGRIARQRGVGIQRDDVLDGRQDGEVADYFCESLARTAAQERVELLQLAPLAFVAHPEPLMRIPDPRPVEQVEHCPALGAVLLDSMP